MASSLAAHTIVVVDNLILALCYSLLAPPAPHMTALVYSLSVGAYKLAHLLLGMMAVVFDMGILALFLVLGMTFVVLTGASCTPALSLVLDMMAVVYSVTGVSCKLALPQVLGKRVVVYNWTGAFCTLSLTLFLVPDMMTEVYSQIVVFGTPAVPVQACCKIAEADN